MKVLLAFALAVTVVSLVGAAPAVADRFVGTGKADVLRGTTRVDELYGIGGNDRVYGRGGRDWVAGGLGDDRLYGGAQGDRVIGFEGDDVLHGGVGAGDHLWGGRGNDLLYSGSSTTGIDYLNAGPGRDTLFLDQGTENVMAGDGNDKIYLLADGSPDVVNCGRGRDLVVIVGAVEPGDRVASNCERAS